MNAISIITRATWDGCRVPTPDERRAHWAAKYFAQGYHRHRVKPRIRLRASISDAELYAREQCASDEPAEDLG